MPLPRRMRRESAAARSGSFQPKDGLLRAMTQAGTSGESWAGLAMGLVAVGTGARPTTPPPPGKAPNRPAGATYFAGVGPSIHSTAARVASGGSVPLASRAGAFDRSMRSPAFFRHSAKSHGKSRSL